MKPAMETIHGSDRRSKPFADITNAPSTTASVAAAAAADEEATPSRPDRGKRRTRTSASGAENNGDDAGLAATPRSSEIATDFTGVAVTHDIADSVTYTRRSTAGRKDKGKALSAVIASSCPPMGRKRKGNLDMEDDEVDLPKEVLVPCQKIKKKRRHTMLGKPCELPRDFVEKQRAYFAEIDAFELLEESASESDT